MPHADLKSEPINLSQALPWQDTYNCKPRILYMALNDLNNQAVDREAKLFAIPADSIDALKSLDFTKLTEPQVIALKKSELLHEIDGIKVAVHWVESAAEIPLRNRRKILRALFDEGLLQASYAKSTEEIFKQKPEVSIELFDLRGKNRRVLLVHTASQKPVVLKYTHCNRIDAEKQFKVMHQVRSNWFKQHPFNNPEECPVVKPLAIAMADKDHPTESREIFTEELVDGPTRGDYRKFLITQGLTEAEVDFRLVRMEAKALAELFLSARSSDDSRGLVLRDLTDRNVKYERNAIGKISAKYFDFEEFAFQSNYMLLGTYLKNPDLDYHRKPAFVLGFFEGLGLKASGDFLKSVNLINCDQLGIAIAFASAINYAWQHNADTDLFPRDDLKLLSKFIAACIYNTDFDEHKNPRNDETIKAKFPKSDLVDSFVKRMGDLFDRTSQGELGFDDFISTLTRIYSEADFIQDKFDYIKPS